MTDTPKEEEAAHEGASSETPSAEEQASVQHEVKEAYEKARDELKATAERLRKEIDQIDTQKIGKSVTTFIQENPGLSLFLALGAGIVAGKVIANMTKEDPPPTLSERVRANTERLAQSARHAAGEAAGRLAVEAREKGGQVGQQLHTVRDSLHARAGSIGTTLSEHAGQLSESATQRANTMISLFSDAAERAADSLHDAAKDLSKSARKYKKASTNTVGSLSQAAKTIFSAYVFKLLSDWIRKRA